MRRVSINDPGAVGELYDRFGSLVFRMAYQSMPTRAEAEDAVQEICSRGRFGSVQLLSRLANPPKAENCSFVTSYMSIQNGFSKQT